MLMYPRKMLIYINNTINIFKIRNYYGHKSLLTVDPEINELIQFEKDRQKSSLNLIASENYCSLATLNALGSCLTDKYSEGYPNSRYYAGNIYIDKIETLVQKRALELFDLSPQEWGVNVQAYSGSIANLAVYTALLNPQDRLMGLELSHGGHLTHGYMFNRRRVSASSLFFESMSYKLNDRTELIDYDELEKLACQFNPKLIIAGASAYSRIIDYARIKQVCEKVGAILMSDISHISGLIAAKIIPSPFLHSDVVTTTTQKLLRSARGALIFYRRNQNTYQPKNKIVDMEKRINRAVFPCLQGGPHNNAIAAIGVSLKEALHPDFIDYQKRIVANCKTLCHELEYYGFRIVSGGSDNHLCLVDLKPQNITGDVAQYILEHVSIIVNKNTCLHDLSPFKPSGLRLGSPPLTSRNMTDKHFKIVVEYLVSTLNLVKPYILENSITSIDKFDELLQTNEDLNLKLITIKNEVESFARTFPIPG